MPAAASAVWKYFKRISDGTHVKCNLCSTVLKYTSGTSNMHNHMRGLHPTDSSASPVSNEKQLSMTLFVNLPQKVSASHAEKITQAIMNMVIFDYVPLSIVQGAGFCNLMKLLAPDYEIPSRTTVRSHMLQHYDNEMAVLTSGLVNMESAALTKDTWTSTAMESYTTFAEHHINTNCEIESNVLLTRSMPERHTGENIAAKLQQSVYEFGLDGKTECVVHDNVATWKADMPTFPDHP